MSEPTCEAVRYAAAKPCDPQGAVWDVVYRSTAGVELDRHSACFTHGMAEFTHGMAEADRHYRSGGIASCELVERRKPTGAEVAR